MKIIIKFIYKYREKDLYYVISHTPYQDGYIFDGWYLDKNYNQKLDFENHTFPYKIYDEKGNYIYKETKVFARWIKDKVLDN